MKAHNDNETSSPTPDYATQLDKLVKDRDYARHIASKFWCKVDTSAGPSGCWPWTACMPKKPGAYGRFGLCRGVIADAHKVAFVLTAGSLSAGEQVLHHCDNSVCVNPSHLYPGTQADNVRDALARGRLRPGGFAPRRPNHQAKLTWKQADAIKRALAQGESPRALAKTHGVCRKTIYDIKSGATWREAA